ncbi:hypothetical protein GCM10028807_30020 [Spirosoma daeguense]
MKKLNDKWLRLIGIPMVAIVSNFIFYRPDNDAHHHGLFETIGLSIIECILVWELGRLGIVLARRTYPRLNQTTPRILYQVAWLVVTVTIQRLAITYLYDKTEFWGYSLPERSYWLSVLIPFVFLVPVVAIYEGRYLYRQWWATYYEAERLKQENLQSQLNSLKAQINPHFLFNSLSTLSSLVTEDPPRAEAFIDELASVYRYVLQTNNQPLTTLATELQFIEAYFHLLQTRFGKGITLDVAVDEEYTAFLLPPLTLQLLVENAVKHNTVLPSRPLQIRIFTEHNNNLFIVNTLHKKQQTILSNRTGLANIQAKYHLLNRSSVIIEQTDDSFQVTLPLISPLSTTLTDNPAITHPADNILP